MDSGLPQVKFPYKTYSDYLTERFPGLGKIQKIGISLGTGCPNRDGTIGFGGCAYCNNAAFTPSYLIEEFGHLSDISGLTSLEKRSRVIRRIFERGKQFFSRKYPDMHFLAYFQSYTNTYGCNTADLIRIYEDVSELERVVGIIIGTRPDCLSDELLDALSEFSAHRCPVLLELGAESSHDDTLNRINRGHTWGQTVDAVKRCTDRGLDVGLHFIMGLPGETETMMLQTVNRAAKLPIGCVKFHQLQIIKGTRLAEEYKENRNQFHLFTALEYAELCKKIISLLSGTNIAIERFVSQAPDNLLIAPRWGIKNYQFVNSIVK